MSEQTSQRVAILKEMALFRKLSEADLEAIAARLHEHRLAAGELLYDDGDRAENFYILTNGRLLNQEIEGGQRIAEYWLWPGDPFGAEALLDGTERRAAVSTLQDADLLYMTGPDFEWMLSQYPSISGGLDHLLAGRDLLREVDFDFLQDNEVVHYAARKHPSTLWFRFARPMLLAIFGLLATYFALGAGPQQQFYLVLGGATLLFGAAAMVVWEALDWRNDFVMITNLRVVWMEQMLLRSSSRIEAPLASIQSVDVYTSLLGRLLGFGDIIVRTYTGTVLMPGVAEPFLTKYLIEDHVARNKKLGRLARHSSIRHAVRQSLGLESEEAAPDATAPRMLVVDQSQQYSFFKTRSVNGDTITYHKHWFTLLRSLLLPALFALAVALGTPFFFSGLPQNPLSWLVVAVAFLAPLGLIGYRLLDWQNDVYIVTADNLIDTERKPLGSEVTKSAPVANILSLENHKVGILGLLLDFGVVRINVGDSQLDFESVANPAQVQRDIFDRMEALKAKRERVQTEDERRRMSEWLRVYEEERQRNNQESGADETAIQ